MVISICGDPGGANAVAPVIEALKTEGRVTVRALAYREARSLWQRRGMVFEEIPQDVADEAVAEMLSQPDVALLLTGTSVNSVDLEKRFIAAARGLGLPSLAVLDFWSNYCLRFSDTNGRLAYVPGLIAVMDERARQEMAVEGLDPERSVVTGQPAFDDLMFWKSLFTPERRLAVRNALGVGPSQLLVVFASQPLSSLPSMGTSNTGFDEWSVLRSLLNALERISQLDSRGIVLAIQLHPREGDLKFSVIRSDAIRVVSPTGVNSRDLVMAADLVTGMNTALLVEACYLGCLVVSLQPGLLLPDVLPTNRAGFSRAVYREENIGPVLEQMLLDDQARLVAKRRLLELQVEGGAAKRVVKLVYQMVGLDRDQEGGTWLDWR